MIEPVAAYDAFTRAGVSFWTGVPDSLLKDLCGYVSDHVPGDRHVIAANEGGAVALAIGHYLATGTPAVVYLQNSGLGNTLNPIVSLASDAVYGIPMVLVVGWRGEPGTKDEPQHVNQGMVTESMLESAGIGYEVMDTDTHAAVAQIRAAVGRAVEQSTPVALVVRAGTFATYRYDAEHAPESDLTREAAITLVADSVGDDDVIVATTGKTSRELYEYRRTTEQPGDRDFLTVGGMGHASQIALGVDLARTDRDVWVFDGDGALVMHLGSLPVIAQHGSTRFRHIVFNNGVHDSVGGQPTPLDTASIPDLARAAGYRHVARASSAAEVTEQLAVLAAAKGPALLEIVVRGGARDDLGRPDTSPEHNKQRLMSSLGSGTKPHDGGPDRDDA
ncbi:MAG: phosphonopyruvate decarboxylase [Acidimicrobiia bacterium]|nr:phosphonopyruvate decarboxylase [Acidimicrobiia bacterium]